MYDKIEVEVVKFGRKLTIDVNFDVNVKKWGRFLLFRLSQGLWGVYLMKFDYQSLDYLSTELPQYSFLVCV